VADSIKLWLGERNFGGGSDEAFLAKWGQLSESAKLVVAGLLEEGGKNAKEMAVCHAVMRKFQMQAEQASQALQDSKLQFLGTDLIKLIYNIHSGDELSVNPTWEFQLRRQTAQWLASRVRSG
jgi:hypothetical protein